MNPGIPPRTKTLRTGRVAIGLLLGLGSALACLADAPALRTLVFFGDSLTAGYGLPDPGTQSYPAQIQARIDAEHLPWKVVNAGLSGETSAGGLRRIDWALNGQVDVLVLELGGNDGLRGTSPEVTQANLQAIIDRVHLKQPGARVVLAGMRMPTNMGPDFDAAFGEIYPALARKNGTALIPFLLEGIAGRPELNQADGIHPNPLGATAVADVVWKAIRPLLVTSG